MTIHVKNAGVWKESTLYVKDAGTWKAVNEGYIKDSGTWKQFFVNRVPVTITISANTNNYVLNTAKVSGYVAGKTDVILNINSGVFISSNSTGTAAFIVDTSWNSGDTIRINNSGTIVGRGGNGGQGGAYSGPGGVSGSGAGGALLVQRSVSINNINRIAGGGGGGGGGGGADDRNGAWAAGGGGGGGIGGSSGGSGRFVPPTGQTSFPGGNGTLDAAGGIGSGSAFAASVGGKNPQTWIAVGGNGGAGGAYGSSGGNGGAGNPASTGAGGGGSGGAAVVGNSNITWIAFGTRNGGIS